MSLASRWTFRNTRDVLRRLPPKPLETRYIHATNDVRHYTVSTPRRRQQRRTLQHETSPKNSAVANVLHKTSLDPTNDLLTAVTIPEDRYGVLRSDHPASSLLANSTIVVQRQLEMMNILVGFEQANRYIIMDAQGNTVGYLAEQDHGFGSAMVRQMARTHRSFTVHVFDKDQREVLRFHRPFSWINSRIRVYDAWDKATKYDTSSAVNGVSAGSIADQSSSQISMKPLQEMRLIGECQQQWNVFRRKYNLFLRRPDTQRDDTFLLSSGDLPLSKFTAVTPVTEDDQQTRNLKGLMAQFAYVNEMLLSWDFTLRSETDEVIGAVNKSFAGFGREIFTDTSVYALRMDAAALAAQQQSHEDEGDGTLGMTLDQRAVMLATAVIIDFDYFSRHSHAGGGWGYWPLLMGGSSEGAAGGAAGGAAAGTAGAEAGATGAGGGVATSEGTAGAVSGDARGAGAIGAGEGAMAGAGTMAGYEAMQRGRERLEGSDDDPSPMNTSLGDARPFEYNPSSSKSPNPQEEVWGDDSWPYSGQRGQDAGDAANDSDGGGETGFSWGDFFGDDG